MQCAYYIATSFTLSKDETHSEYHEVLVLRLVLRLLLKFVQALQFLFTLNISNDIFTQISTRFSVRI